MKKIVLSLFVLILFISCDELNQVVTQLPDMGTGIGNVSQQEIGLGLKEALDKGVIDGVNQLSKKDGFFKDEAAKILLPDELKSVDKTLRSIGLSSLADEGIKVLNRAAEDAVTEAAPIFKNAITSMSFTDAKNILLGNDNAATSYLQNKTTSQLVSAFKPKVDQSLGKVGADKIWDQIITKYNTFSGKNVNTDLASYVTEQAISGLFTKVALKEKDIRNNIGARSSDLLAKVFALQDK